MQILTQKILDVVKSLYLLDLTDNAIELETPPKKEFGDYAFSVFSLSKALKKAPPVIAEEIKSELEKESGLFQNVSILGGYINFFVPGTVFAQGLFEFVPKQGEKNNKTIVVDYIGTNVGKPAHIAHLCTPSIGQSIVNMYKHAGYDVIGDSHLGDWGGIFGKLITGYKLYGNEDDLKKDPVEYLLSLYIRITAEAENDPAIEERCRNEFKKLSEEDNENMELWAKFTTYSIQGLSKIIDLIYVRADYDIGESFYEWLNLPKIGNQPPLQYDMKSVVAELIEKGIATKNEDGSTGVVFPEETKIPSCILQKRDGTHGYLASDLAAIKYRLTNGWDPSKIIYCVDIRQQLHFRQAFYIAKQAWPDLLENVELFHAHNGFIKLKDGAMSTRKGNIIRLQDLINEGFQRTKNILEEKNQHLSDEDVQSIAVGAIKYSYLSVDREKDVVFDWDKALAFEGNSGPYIQYTYVRAKNILAKTQVKPVKISGSINLSEYDTAVIKKLFAFPKAFRDAMSKYKPHILANYLYELSSEFNAFYVHTPKILEEKNEDLQGVRLAIIEKTANLLSLGFDLLAIKMPSKM